MLMWLFIMLGTILASVAGLIYLISRIGKFYFVRKITKDNNKWNILVSAVIALAGILALWGIFNYVNLCVILIHLTIFWLISEAVSFLVCKIICKAKEQYKEDSASQDNRAVQTEKRKLCGHVYIAGIVALLVTFLYLSYGWYMDRHVFVTEYNITTDKVVEPLKIVQITDSHMGTTFDGDGFGKHVETIQSLQPDIVLITGDYIDGSSRYKDIITATKALGTLTTKYGTYFIYGNHDKNYYGEDGRRDFTQDDLTKELRDNNVTVLEDEVVLFGNGYALIGRQDKTVANRMSISDLMKQVDDSLFTIDMNHQPNDYANEAASGVDLVLSGHTHGGQLFPIRDAGVWMGANDKTYGYEKRERTSFIVSSGISDWAIDFKTGCKSEIVVINICPEK